MHENIIIAIIAAIAPTLAVIFSTIITFRSTGKQNIKLDQIHVLTNENFSKALAKIDKLEAIISTKKSEELKEAKKGT